VPAWIALSIGLPTVASYQLFRSADRERLAAGCALRASQQFLIGKPLDIFAQNFLDKGLGFLPLLLGDRGKLPPKWFTDAKLRHGLDPRIVAFILLH
jgi:hypothetical protein